MAVTTFGTITLVDITDVGELSVYPMSNMPLSVIYDPDQNTYTPTWSSSAPLELTPVVYYAGKNLAMGSTGLEVIWKRKVGSNAQSDLTSGESVVNGVLKVTANKFSSTVSLLTYIVTVNYTEPTSGTILTAAGQITFSLIKHASQIKSCEISGETIFKYNTSQTLVGASSITLTATVNNVSISQWQYKNSSGTWTQISGSGTSTTLTIDATNDEALFVNDVCTIKLATNDANVYDIHTITKLRDGAPGEKSVTAVLTNEDQMVPVSKSGVRDYTGCTSRIIVYEGGIDKTAEWTITVSPASSSSLTYTKSKTTATNDTVTVTKMTGNTGNITFTAKKSGFTDQVKTFSLVAIEAGKDGVDPVIYSVESTSLALNRDINGAYTPNTVTFNAYQQTGEDKTAYSGRFMIFEDIDLAGYEAASPKPTAKYTSLNDESSYEYTPSNNAVSSILCLLFEGGATTKRYDAQSVVVTTDGKTGSQGPQGKEGKSAVNVILGNYADVIPCTSDNKTAAQVTITIPFSGYLGTTQKAVTCASPPTLFGKTPTNNPGTASSNGSLVYTIPAGTSISSDTGVLSLVFSCESASVTKEYRWTRSTAAANSVLFQLLSPNGYVFQNSEGTLPIVGYVTEGTTDKTSSVTEWKWYKFSSGSYTQIAGKGIDSTAATLTVNGNTVNGYASFKCEAKYGGKTYTQYYSLIDKTDPLQCTVLSSVGSQIVNKQGVGALYVRVTQNGIEIDELKSEVFSETAPSSPSSGDYYWKLDKTNKTVTLMKYSGSAWAAAPASDTTYNCAYNWYYRDKDGNRVTPTGLATSGKVIYIDGSFITGKITADVEVVYPKPTS